MKSVRLTVSEGGREGRKSKGLPFSHTIVSWATGGLGVVLRQQAAGRVLV